jgi:hypothetical protein
MTQRKSGESDLLDPIAVGRLLGVSSARVRQLDAELRPLRTASGRRIYQRAAVERYAQARARAAVERAQRSNPSTEG